MESWVFTVFGAKTTPEIPRNGMLNADIKFFSQFIWPPSDWYDIQVFVHFNTNWQTSVDEENV